MHGIRTDSIYGSIATILCFFFLPIEACFLFVVTKTTSPTERRNIEFINASGQEKQLKCSLTCLPKQKSHFQTTELKFILSLSCRVHLPPYWTIAYNRSITERKKKKKKPDSLIRKKKKKVTLSVWALVMPEVRG